MMYAILYFRKKSTNLIFIASVRGENKTLLVNECCSCVAKTIEEHGEDVEYHAVLTFESENAFKRVWDYDTERNELIDYIER